MLIKIHIHLCYPAATLPDSSHCSRSETGDQVKKLSELVFYALGKVTERAMEVITTSASWEVNEREPEKKKRGRK